MFIVVSKIQAPAARKQAVWDGFEKAAPSMKQFRGFLGLELWNAEDDDTVLAVSRWESKEAMEEYLNNDLFKHHHGGASSGPQRPSDQQTYYTGKVLS
ncbi:MAG TPA: antibiotic biosynthesis monooxygenase family protein [Ktedonosporobacter sp.]|nr:antibiotic biosynthesis monooxygenase family protein [Ktedonosporobacter sp.]